MMISLTFNPPFLLPQAISPSKFTDSPLIKTKWCSNLSLKQTYIKNTVTCARNNKRRTGYRRINRFVLESVYFCATNLDILPEPLALMVKEFRGGSGGGVGFLKGLGGGGRKKNNKNSLFLIFVIVFGFVMWIGLGEKSEGDFSLVILALIVFVALISKFWKRGFKDWAQGVCFIAAIGFLGLRRENLQTAKKGFGAMINSRRRKRRAM